MRPLRCLLLLGLAVVGLAALGRCASRPDPSAAASLIVVTLDTTRADRVGAFGGRSVPTPNLDRVARQGTIFPRAYAVAPLTLPSHASIFTGRFPGSHGARHNGLYRLQAAETTLAEHLKAAGFETAAFTAALVVARGTGLEQGFDLYDEVPPPAAQRVEGVTTLQEAQRTAEEVNASVFAWLENPPAGRFFLWVHYYDPHWPYDPPEGAGRRLEGSGYDREISYVDACLGELVERLESKGLLDRSILVVVGDHGESLGEHGERTHGIFLYDSAVRVPMMIRAPRLVPEGHSVAEQVSTLDLAPTIVELLGLPPLETAQGKSLVSRIDGDSRPAEVVFAETLMPRLEFGWSELRMVQDERFKYIQAPREELYDLAEDPGELHNLATIEEQRTRRMADLLVAWVRDTESHDGSVAQRQLSAEELERLRSLGYLAGSEGGLSATVTGIDPKDALGVSERLFEAEALVREGNREGAIPVLETVVAESPANPVATSLLIKILVDLGKLERAEALARSTLTAALTAPPAEGFLRQTRLRLAAVLHLQGREEEAEVAYREALEAWGLDDSTTPLFGERTAVAPETARRVFEGLLVEEPGHPIALAGLLEQDLEAGDRAAAILSADRIARSGAADRLPGPLLFKGGKALLDGGEPEAAVELFRPAVEKLGRQPDLMGYLGTALLSAGRVDEAGPALEEAKRLRPDDPRPHFYLGNIALLRNQEEQARTHYREALNRDPDWTEPLDNLALWLISQGRSDEAIATLTDALERNPNDARAQDLMAKLKPGRAAPRGASR